MVAPGDAFQHYFWGDKNAGYDVLLTNMKQAATASKEFHEILRERVNYEEAFSKSLRRLSEKASTINSVGSFLPVWTVLKKYIENMSKIHSDFSARFKELCQELNTFKTDSTSKTNKMLKEQMDIIKTSAALSNIKNSLEHVNKCKKLYQQKHKELIESEESLTKAGLAADKTEKEQEKIQQKFTKSQEAFMLAENTYKSSVEKYNKAQEEYNEDMTNSCKFFGEMEQAHLNQIVEFAKRFGDIETDLVEELKKNCESILGGDNDEDVKGLVGYTPEHLIEIFVEEKKTGVEMCPLMETELLTVKDPPVLSMTPKPTHTPHEKSRGTQVLDLLKNVKTPTPAGSPTFAPRSKSLGARPNKLRRSKDRSAPGIPKRSQAPSTPLPGDTPLSPSSPLSTSSPLSPKSPTELLLIGLDSPAIERQDSEYSISTVSSSKSASRIVRITIGDDEEDVMGPQSDSGSVNSIPNVHNTTTVTTASSNTTNPTPPNMNSMTLAMSNVNVGLKQFRKMIKKTKKPKNKNEGDNKSIDSKTEDQENGVDDVSEKSTSEHDSAGHRSEQDFYERHGTAYFSSDDDEAEGDDDSDEDGLTAKVRTIKIRNTTEQGGTPEVATEEELRKATEKLTLSCLSPNTLHRDRSKTHNPQLFSAYSHSLVDLPVSPEPAPKATFPTTFNTPRAKSVSGNISSPRPTPRNFTTEPIAEAAETAILVPEQNSANSSDAWAVFDDSFKSSPKRASDSAVLDSVASWSTPPTTKRTLFDEHKIEQEKATEKDNGLDGLLEFAPTSLKTPEKVDGNCNLDDLLSITIDEPRATSPASEYMVGGETPDGSPTNSDSNSNVLVPDETVDIKNGDKVELDNDESGSRRKRLPSLIEFSPVKPLSQEPADPLSSTQRSEEDGVLPEVESSQSPVDSADTDSGVHVDGSVPGNLALSNDIDVEDSKLLSPLSVDSKISVDSCDVQLDKPNGLIPIIKPTLATGATPEPPAVPYLTKPATTENVEFSAQHEDTAENDREEIPYPIAIAIIETASAVFKPNNECTSKIEGELIMSLPCDAAAELSTNISPPALKIRLVSTTTPNSFIVNRQIFSIKPPSILDVLEVNMTLLQGFLKKRLENIGNQQRINIPLLKYKSPYLKAELAPLIAQSYWTTTGNNTVLSIDASVNKSLADQNFHFPRITFSNSFKGSTPVLSSEPPADFSNKRLRWERLDVGNEMLDNPDKLVATFDLLPDGERSRTDIEFEVEGVVISGTDVVLENSECYSIATTVKKMRSDKYWTEPKVLDSNC